MLTMEEALKQSSTQFATGQIVKGIVIEVRPKEVLVDIGYKSEGVIPANEFDDIKLVKIGDEVDVLIEKLEDKEGMVVLSKEKAEFKKNWDKILTICNEGGTIQGKVKTSFRPRTWPSSSATSTNTKSSRSTRNARTSSSPAAN
jgi:small subunit ribosomal protein S1